MSKYIVRINTAGADTCCNRRSWERQLIDDFIRAIDGKRFECNDADELAERIGFIFHTHNNMDRYIELKNDVNNYVTLRNPMYGERVLPIALYGTFQNKVDFQEIYKTVEEKFQHIIFFSHYYGKNQRHVFKNCFILIQKIDKEKE